jgi:hypothetical protein
MRTAEVSWRRGFWQTFIGSMPRDEFFAGLYILGCANGIGLRVIKSISEMGWADASLVTFEVSGIVWLACLAGISLLLQDKTGKLTRLDLLFGAGFLVLIAVPINPAIWLAITLLGLYILLITRPPSARRRGAIILLATTVPMFWSPYFFKFYANFILNLDASLVGWVLHSTRVGNMVRFADNSGWLVIFPACSSLANVSHALLAWIAISQFFEHRWSPLDIVWCSMACAAVITVNVTRMSIMGLSPGYYQLLHDPSGELVVNIIILLIVFGFCLFGVRRDVFARA